MLHTVESTTETVRSGFLDPSASPVATIQSGDIVSYPNTWTHWGNEATFGMTFAEREPLRHRYPNGPYSMLGPVEVSGAEPGDVIECTARLLADPRLGMELLSSRGGGPARRLQPALRALLPLRRCPTEHRVRPRHRPHPGPLPRSHGRRAGRRRPRSAPSWPAPTAGTSSSASSRWGRRCSCPWPSPAGGCGSETSTPCRVTAWSTRRPSRRPPRTCRSATPSTSRCPLQGPLAETPTHWIGLGFADNLDDALVACLRGLIAWLHAASGMAEGEAYALCSMAASFRVTQYAHQTGSAYTSTPPKTVHGMVPKEVFPPKLQNRIGLVAPSDGQCVDVTLPTADRLDILDVLARADTAATRRDADAYVALFTEDAALDGAKGEHRGREALSRSVGPIWRSEGATSVHLTLNAVVDPVEGRPDRAVATSMLLIVVDGSPPSMHSVSLIVQYLVKAGPSWLIERRSVHPVDAHPASALGL